MGSPVSSYSTRPRRPRRDERRHGPGTPDGGVLALLTTAQREVFVRALARIAWAAAEPANPPTAAPPATTTEPASTAVSTPGTADL